MNAIGTSQNDLRSLLREALGSYNKYIELDAQTFVEFLSLQYPEIKRNDPLAEALKKIWRDISGKAAYGVKTNIECSFDFIEEAYNQARYKLMSLHSFETTSK